DDDRKVGAFITPADGSLRNYQAALNRFVRDDSVDGVSDALESALATYTGLEELGLVYQVDPTSPFTRVQENTVIIDSVSLPRDTLRRYAGDCDDLTVLFCSMLESAGVETGFITVPGHIYPVINTKVPAAEFRYVHPDRSMSINLDGELWVPVEVTLLGSADFVSAWRRGIELYEQFNNDPDLSGFYLTADAQAVYRPVGLRQADLGLQYGTETVITREFSSQLDKLVDTILSDFENRARGRNRPRDHNALGIAQARFGELTASQASFRTAIRLDSDYLEPRVNLGALELLRGNYYGAILALQGAANRIEAVPDANPETRSAVYINLARAHYGLEEYDDAKNYFAMATDIDPERAAEFSYLASVAADGSSGRASEVNKTTIPFAGEGTIPGAD
ncbi:MAG: tetratricopeptide repeat protein, partial [Spirochaetaceae bacterium]|nr:tetratricopeptide repeat protein [Spirochaetaceae bacterium]